MRENVRAPANLSGAPEIDVEQVLRTWLPQGYALQRAGLWLSVVDPRRGASQIRQGWKLHVSARPQSLQATVERVLPALFATGCDFKIVATRDLLEQLNSGLYGVAAVGKAITIYPDQDGVVEIANTIADALTDFDAPRIVSDRRLRQDAPVYYRFGPFRPHLALGENGDLDALIESEDGSTVSGLAGDLYRQPDWVVDPFAEGARGETLPRLDDALIIADRYLISGAIARTHRGGAYRATDRTSGQRLIVKEARAFVNESSRGDCRTYLRQERRILQQLDGIYGVPRLIDHFAYGPDEFLVMTDLGSINLRDDIVEFGPFALDPSAKRNIGALALDLLRVLDAIHQRGVIYRDLAPKNIIRLGSGGWGLVDFELSRWASEQLYGWTPGYSRLTQRRDAPATLGDDLFSFGMTLFHAATGLEPVMVDTDPRRNTARTLAGLAAACGRSPFVAIVRDLLGSDPQGQRRAADRLRKGVCTVAELWPLRVRRAPAVDTILRHTLRSVRADAVAMLEHHQDQQLPPSINAYSGTTGIALELAQHTEGLDVARDLAHLTAQVLQSVSAGPALMYGRAGIAWMLHVVASATGDERLYAAAHATIPDEQDIAALDRADFTHGLAGVGTTWLAAAATNQNGARALGCAAMCADKLIETGAAVEEQLRALPPSNPAHAIAVADGFAHGSAGIACFLLGYAARSGDARSREHARHRLDKLASCVPALVEKAGASQARPMAASWCQGLAGIGTALVRAAVNLDDDRLLAASSAAAAGCMAVAPRVPLITQCCGLAGVGDFLLDLEEARGDGCCRQQAIEVLELMLMRSGGSPSAPCFPDNTMLATSPAWAIGTSGILSFLRRLADPSEKRLWMAEPLPGWRARRATKPERDFVGDACSVNLPTIMKSK